MPDRHERFAVSRLLQIWIRLRWQGRTHPFVGEGMFTIRFFQVSFFRSVCDSTAFAKDPDRRDAMLKSIRRHTRPRLNRSYKTLLSFDEPTLPHDRLSSSSLSGEFEPNSPSVVVPVMEVCGDDDTIPRPPVGDPTVSADNPRGAVPSVGTGYEEVPALGLGETDRPSLFTRMFPKC